jgi:hypothetical protein
MKYTHVQIKTVRCVPVRSNLQIINVFLCTDSTELSGQVGIAAAADNYRFPGFASRPDNRPRSVIIFVIFLTYLLNNLIH